MYRRAQRGQTMNTDHLKSFITTVDSGSITKAASRLFITPPSLHQQLSLLEEEVGCKLLSRNNKGVTPTPAGEYFYQSARRVSELLDEAIEQTVRHSLTKQPLRIGYFDSADLFFLEAFMKRFPETSVELTQLHWDGVSGLYRLLVNHDLDITCSEVTSEANRHNCSFLPVKQDHISVLMSPSHPLAGKKTISKKDLDQQTVFINSKDSPVVELAREMNLPVNYISIEEKPEKIITLCYQGNLYLGETQYLKNTFPLKVRTIVPKHYIHYGILYHNKNDNPHIQEYVSFVKTMLAQ